MAESELFGVVTHLFVALKRKSGRAIDTVWAAQNKEYAREVLRVARQYDEPDMVRLADRFEELMLGVMRTRPVTAPEAMPEAEVASEGRSGRYIGLLR